MANPVSLHVTLIGRSEFIPPQQPNFTTDATGGQALAEFAGRACYESFDKPNPRTASNDAYLRHIMEVGHTSVLEHATATLYIRGISRGASGELLRHRHFSFSQLSQRFVPEDDVDVLIPAMIEEDEDLKRLFIQAMDQSRAAFDDLLDALEEKLGDSPTAWLQRKKARQAARAVLPMASESRIVVTGNYRAWRHFIAMRASEHADAEIREVAVACLEVLLGEAPSVFGDFEIATLSDGSRMATSPEILDI